MAYEIDPFEELERFLPKCSVSTIRMLFSGDSPLDPGEKVRLAEACTQLGKVGKSDGLADAVVTRGEKRVAKGTLSFPACGSTRSLAYEKDALKEAVAKRLLPKKDHPEAWRISRGGGQVKAEVGPSVIHVPPTPTSPRS